MVHLNASAGEIHIKIVYFSAAKGAGLNSLNNVKSGLPKGNTGNIIMLSTESGQTFFFDFMPVTLGKVKDYTVYLKLYSAPEADYYEAARKLVLNGADGIIFIADSRAEKKEESLKLLENLDKYIEGGVKNIPCTFMWDYSFGSENSNNALSCSELDSLLNRYSHPSFKISHVTGEGVLEALKETVKQVVSRMQRG